MATETNGVERTLQMKEEQEYKARVVRNQTPLITEFLDNYKDALKDKKLCEEGVKGKLVEVSIKPFLLQLLLDYENFKIDKKRRLF